MRPRCLCSLALVLTWLSPLAAGAAETPFAELARHVPDSANAIVLVNVQKLFSRPMAQAEGWRENAEKRIAGGLTSIPIDAEQLLLAAQLDLRSMRPVWQLAMIQMDAAPSLATLARQHGGVTDTLGTMPGLRLPDDSYLVRFSDQTLGGFAPGNRQAVSRWTRDSGSPLSAPLQEAIGYAAAGAEIIMALDLADVAALEDVQEGIEAFDAPLLKEANLDLKELAQLLASVKSLMLGMTFDQRPFGKIKLEFGRDVSVPPQAVKPLLLAILASRGLMIDEFENWKAEVDGRRIMFGGYLTSSGLTRLSSLVDLPTGAFHNLREVPLLAQTGSGAGPDTPAAIPSQEPPSKESAPAKSPPTSPVSSGQVPYVPETSPGNIQPIVKATREYFCSTRQLLTDLRGRKREAKTITQIGGWYEMYARRIDRFPLLNVDDQMVGYGGYVGNQLRGASLALKGSGIRTHVGQVAAVNQGVRETYQGTAVTPRYIIRGQTTITRGLTPQERAAVSRQVRVQETAAAVTSVQQIETELDAATSEIRGAMTKKYQAEF